MSAQEKQPAPGVVYIDVRPDHVWVFHGRARAGKEVWYCRRCRLKEELWPMAGAPHGLGGKCLP